MELFDALDEALRPFTDFARYEQGSLFSRKVKLDYRGFSNQPWLTFRCLTDDAYSFNIHDLQMADEFVYWQGSAKRDKPMSFNGHVNYLYRMGIGALRGFMNVEGDPWKLGVYVINRKLIGALTEKVRTKNIAEVMNMLMLYSGDVWGHPDDAA